MKQTAEEVIAIISHLFCWFYLSWFSFLLLTLFLHVQPYQYTLNQKTRTHPPLLSCAIPPRSQILRSLTQDQCEESDLRCDVYLNILIAQRAYFLLNSNGTNIRSLFSWLVLEIVQSSSWFVRQYFVSELTLDPDWESWPLDNCDFRHWLEAKKIECLKTENLSYFK